MKRICMVVQMIYDFDVRVRRKAEALVEAGYTVDVLGLRPLNGKKSYSLNGVNVRTLSIGKKRGSLFRYVYEYLVFFLWTLFHLTIRSIRKPYAVVDVNTLPDFLIFAGATAKLRGTELILDMHEITPEFYMSKYGSERESWSIRLMTFLERVSFQFADRVITIHKPIEDLLVERGLERLKSTIIMNAADERRLAGKTVTHANSAGEEGDKFVMMYHGTLTRIYGLDIAIEAFARVHDKMPNAEFWILGGGTEEAALAQLVQDCGLSGKVKLVGIVPGSEIAGWLSQCDVGVLPIRRDVFLDFAFPNKLPELMIMSKSVIVSRLKAIRYYFSEDAVAYFEPNSAEDLARQMLRLYQDPKLRNRLVDRAREEYFPIRWDIMKRRYVDLVDSLARIERHNTGEAASLRRTSVAAK